MSHYRCQIPELCGRYIRGCFHGWVVLSDRDKWSLWNPISTNFIHLPHLILKDGDSNDILHCCLSSPPDDPGCILLLTRDRKPNIVFCRLDHKSKRLRWAEFSYSKQLMSITNGEEDDILLEPTCCNGKVYALTNASECVIEVNILVKKKKVVISLLPFVSVPEFYTAGRCFVRFLKGSCEELFVIELGFIDEVRKKLLDVRLCKLDMTSMVWAEMNVLKGTIFCVDESQDQLVTCSPAIASELGGYIHILHKTGKVIYSYDVKDKSISQFSMHCLGLPPRFGDLRTSHISVWTIPKFRFQGDDGEAKCKSDSKHDEGKEDGMVVRSCKNDEVEFNSKTNELQLLNIPFHVLEMIMEFCVGVEYLNFRATCKLCHLAAPVIQWSNEKARRRLQTYSLSSPWLMAFEKDQGIITFTDPMFGDKYYIKASTQELFFEKRILCSSYGWLLLYVGLQRMVFFNPFTNDIHELPPVGHVDNFCFSAPPTSPDCMVVAFSTMDGSIFLHSVGREPTWRMILLDFGGEIFPSFSFPVFCGRDVFALSKEGGLQVFKGGNLSLETVVA
ncbi:hypothetical protein L6452_20757 [Arctium lappa]|uniref:Uncharacterized protein n=1 Tax=Arctium lappa TaxID=4217 RepID=A0ACB9BBS3_ARCLA|nr:hypothetical protein L6452_20757 [Arctium lappa]